MNRLNIYHRLDGRWEGRIYKEKKNGKRQYRAFYGKSRDEVTEKISSHFSQKEPNCTSLITLSQLYDEWISSNLHRIKESTAANYKLKADKHILPEFGCKLVSEFAASDIYSFIRKKQKEGLSNRYISDIIIMMKSIFKYGTIHYQILNPMDGITMPKKKQAEIRLLNTEEQKSLQTYIEENHNLTTLGISLAKYTGLRIGELCALKWSDIDLKKRILIVRKTVQRIQCKNGRRKTKLIITEPKTESSKRQIPIPEFIADFLSEFQSDKEIFVISGKKKPTEPRTMQYRFAKILKNGKLPSVHFHALRHMFASNCIQLGFDVKALSEILGHSSVEITLNRYVHSSFEQKTEYMNRLKIAV